MTPANRRVRNLSPFPHLPHQHTPPRGPILQGSIVRNSTQRPGSGPSPERHSRNLRDRSSAEVGMWKSSDPPSCSEWTGRVCWSRASPHGAEHISTARRRPRVPDPPQRHRLLFDDRPLCQTARTESTVTVRSSAAATLCSVVGVAPHLPPRDEPPPDWSLSGRQAHADSVQPPRGRHGSSPLGRLRTSCGRGVAANHLPWEGICA